MLVVGVLYGLLHSPLRPTVDTWLGTDSECISLCGPGLGQVAAQLTMAWYFGWAALAATVLVPLLGLRAWERPVAWGVLAFALVSVPAALVGGTGDLVGRNLLRLPYGPLLGSGTAVAIVAWAAWRGWRPRAPRLDLAGVAPVAWWLTLMVAVGLIASVGAAIARPLTGFDELNYHAPLAVDLWQLGSLSSFLSESPAGYWLSHPGSAELWLGGLKVIGGEPLMTVGQLPFALLAALGAIALGRRAGLSGRAATIGGLTLLLVPMVLIQSGRASNDIAGAALAIAAAAFIAVPTAEWSARRVVLVALTLALLVATKLALLPTVAVLGVAAIAWSRRAYRDGGLTCGSLLRGWAGGLLLGLAVVAPWWIRNIVLFGNPLYPADVPFLAGISQLSRSLKDTQFLPSAEWWPLYPMLEEHSNASGVGAVWAVTIIPALVIAVRVARGRRPLQLIAAVALCTLPAWWLLTRHEPRFLLGLLGMTCALVPFALAGVTRRWRTAVAVAIGAAATMSVAVTVTAPVADLLAQPVERVAFYEDTWATDPVIQVLPERQGLLIDDRCATRAIALLYPLLGPGQRRHTAYLACGASPQDVVTRLEALGMHRVYAAAQVADVAAFETRYPVSLFELIHSSTVGTGASAVERRLYQLRPGS